MSWQLFVALGVACGFLAALIVQEIGLGDSAWRWQTASVILALGPMLALTPVISESPRYLMKKNRMAEAFRTLCTLRETPLQAARDLIYINAQMQAEIILLPAPPADPESYDHRQEMQQHRDDSGSEVKTEPVSDGKYLVALQERLKRVNYWTRLGQIFRNKRTRRGTGAASLVMLAQQLCGINVLLFYSSNILHFLRGKDLTDDVPYWLNFGVGLVNFVGTFPAFFGIDSKGRRFLLLTTYPIMALSMMAIAVSFECRTREVAAVLVIVFIFIFVSAYAMGQGPGKNFPAML